jgi:flagellar M-ring protein FliF
MVAIGFLILVMFVIRPLLASLRLGRRPTLESFEAIGATGEQLTTSERALINAQMAEQKDLIEQAKKDPYQVAQILQNWVSEDK